MPLLKASNLHVRYGERLAIADVSLDVYPGEVLAVVGASGSGKTTLLHCLCGLQIPDEGTVEFMGSKLHELSTRQRDALRRDNFGFVFQFGDLVPELTVLENVSLPMRLKGVGGRQSRTRARERLEALGIAALAHRAVGEVSGGELQRAAIARSLVHDPSVVFADEPTGALDEENSQVVFELLLAQAREHHAAVLVVTHDRSLAAQADRVLTLDGSRVSGRR